MKKILALLLAVTMVFALAACNKTEVAPQEEEIISTPGADIEADNNAVAAPESEAKDDDVPATEIKPEAKPETEADTPEASAPTSGTVGNLLLADFKAKAGSASSMLSLAESLAAHEIIPFRAGALEIEPGLLAGFGNTEIKGFKSGASFAPMMGSIAFVGYVFELENGADVNAFISTLRSNADLRWNVCVEADEMVTGNVGNKVFFVMCPKQFEA